MRAHSRNTPLILGLTETHSGFGIIPNSWCSGPQIKGHCCVGLLTTGRAQPQTNLEGATGGLCPQQIVYKISNKES